MTVEVWLDGELQQAVEVTAANLFRFDNKFVVGSVAKFLRVEVECGQRCERAVPDGNRARELVVVEA